MTAAARSDLASLCADRRNRLLRSLGEGLLLVPAGAAPMRNGDVHYTFRPGSDFWYLTGFPEPHGLLAAWRDGSKVRSVLFVQPRDTVREIWDGKRFGTAGAKRQFGVDEAHSIEDLPEKLEELVDQHQRLFHTLGANRPLDDQLMRIFRRLAQRRRRQNPAAHPVLQDPRPAINEQRLHKTKAELEAMRRAAEVTVAGHRIAMQATQPGMFEYEVEAAMEAEFRRLGSPRNGYDSIVASGANACILHYVENSRKMRRGELLLIDAGAEVDGYTADITRTFPVDGTFTPEQKAVYQVVLRAQKAAIAKVTVGRKWDEIHKTAIRELTKGMVQLGALKGDPKKLIEKGQYKHFYMHGTSHWLGLDVHDVGAYEDANGKPLRLEEGQVLTVEPGLYFGPRNKKAPTEYRGIGVRIEDDVLVTAKGPEILTAAIPKEVRDIEALCSG